MMRPLSVKELLATSLLELAAEKSLNKITIQDIAANCGLRRETFYLHFQDKYALLQYIYESRLFAIQKGLLNHVPLTKIQLYSLNFLREHAHFAKAAFEDKQTNSLREIIFRSVSDTMILFVKQFYQTESLSEEMILSIHIYTHGCIELVSDWVKQDFRQPPELLTTAMTDAIPQSFQKIFYCKK